MTRRSAMRAFLVICMLLAATPPVAAADTARPRAPQVAKAELSLLARVVQREATGEPTAGMRAVAWTVVNRLRQPEIYGRTITQVLQRHHQYARPKPLKPNSPAYQAALAAATQVLRGEGGDPSLSATHFIRCDMRRRPAWAARFTFTIKIASHCFYRKAPHYD